MDNGLSASDVALMSRNDGFGFGDSSFVWIFGLLILMGMFNGGGFGGWGNNAAFDRLATQSDVQYTSQFAQLLDGNRDIMSQANNNTNNIIQAVNSSEYETIASMKDAQLQLQDRISGVNVGQSQILANQNECCCNTRLEIANQSAGINQNLMQNRYEGALNTAAINENTTAQIQALRNELAQDKIDRLQNEVNQLNLANQMANVVRFPNQYTFNGGVFPPFTGCGCTGTI